MRSRSASDCALGVETLFHNAETTMNPSIDAVVSDAGAGPDRSGGRQVLRSRRCIALVVVAASERSRCDPRTEAG
jgi:hypothetical protein